MKNFIRSRYFRWANRHQEDAAEERRRTHFKKSQERKKKKKAKAHRGRLSAALDFFDGFKNLARFFQDFVTTGSIVAKRTAQNIPPDLRTVFLTKAQHDKLLTIPVVAAFKAAIEAGANNERIDSLKQALEDAGIEYCAENRAFIYPLSLIFKQCGEICLKNQKGIAVPIFNDMAQTNQTMNVSRFKPPDDTPPSSGGRQPAYIPVKT